MVYILNDLFGSFQQVKVEKDLNTKCERMLTMQETSFIKALKFPVKS